MLALGITDYREVQCAPWRIFYYIGGNRVGIVAVLDGRRNVGVLLQQRLLQ
jgi:plasmid stabilization system protein ParE